MVTTKYCLILAVALVLSTITYSATPLDLFRVEFFQTVAHRHQQWMLHSHSLLSWYASGSFACVVVGWLVTPIVAALITTLKKFKPRWLPQVDDPFDKFLNFWVYLYLGSLGLTLLTRALEMQAP